MVIGVSDARASGTSAWPQKAEVKPLNVCSWGMSRPRSAATSIRFLATSRHDVLSMILYLFRQARLSQGGEQGFYCLLRPGIFMCNPFTHFT